MSFSGSLDLRQHTQGVVLVEMELLGEARVVVRDEKFERVTEITDEIQSDANVDLVDVTGPKESPIVEVACVLAFILVLPEISVVFCSIASLSLLA